MCQSLPIFTGGPVQTDRGFVLHPSGPQYQATLELGEAGLSTSQDVLFAIADGSGPDKCLITLGYAGWDAGQLEAAGRQRLAHLPCGREHPLRSALRPAPECRRRSSGVNLSLLLAPGRTRLMTETKTKPLRLLLGLRLRQQTDWRRSRPGSSPGKPASCASSRRRTAYRTGRKSKADQGMAAGRHRRRPTTEHGRHERDERAENSPAALTAASTCPYTPRRTPDHLRGQRPTPRNKGQTSGLPRTPGRRHRRQTTAARLARRKLPGLTPR